MSKQNKNARKLRTAKKFSEERKTRRAAEAARKAREDEYRQRLQATA